jgi:hypothetical protein
LCNGRKPDTAISLREKLSFKPTILWFIMRTIRISAV